MRIAIVTESFAPYTDASAGSVARMCEYLQGCGHTTLVLAEDDGPTRYADATIVRDGAVETALVRFCPDVVHLVGTSTLAAEAGRVAHQLAVPVVGDHRFGGLDLDLFHPSRRDRGLRARLAVNGEMLVGYAHALTDAGDADLLAVLDGRSGVRLVIVGDGPQRSHFEQALPNAAFLGELDGAELAAALASLDVFVQPGSDETCAAVAREAMAAGVPLVAAAEGTMRELVVAGRTGYLIEAGSPVALAARIATLACDPDLRAQLAVAARETISRCTLEAQGEQLVARYRAALVGAVAA